MHNSVGVTRCLLAALTASPAGADGGSPVGTAVSCVDDAWMTPLHVAIAFGGVECVRLLLAHGADVTLMPFSPDHASGRGRGDFTPLPLLALCAFQANDDDAVAMASTLLQADATVTQARFPSESSCCCCCRRCRRCRCCHRCCYCCCLRRFVLIWAVGSVGAYRAAPRCGFKSDGTCSTAVV